MFDIAWSEMLVVGAVALVAIGPRDLPKAMLAAGRMARKARLMAQHMRQQFDQLTYEAEVAAQAEELKKQAAETPPPPQAGKPHE